MKVAIAAVDRMLKKAYDMLAYIVLCIKYRNWDIILRLYKTLVQLQMEHCVQFCLQKNVIKR